MGDTPVFNLLSTDKVYTLGTTSEVPKIGDTVSLIPYNNESPNRLAIAAFKCDDNTPVVDKRILYPTIILGAVLYEKSSIITSAHVNDDGTPILAVDATTIQNATDIRELENSSFFTVLRIPEIQGSVRLELTSSKSMKALVRKNGKVVIAPWYDVPLEDQGWFFVAHFFGDGCRYRSIFFITSGCNATTSTSLG